MPEELLEFENTVEDQDGKSWVAIVMGGERDDGKWIGWIRFDPKEGGEPLVTERETTQPNRPDLAYWASGLTYFYLEGALARARRRRERESASDRDAAAAERQTHGGQPRERPPDRGVRAELKGSASVATRATAPAPDRIPERGVPRLEVRSADGRVAEEIMGMREPRPGTLRRVPDAGVVIYEGASEEAGSAVHRFSVQAGDGAARSNMSNWLWSRLHRAGARATVDGSGKLETNADLRQALER